MSQMSQDVTDVTTCHRCHRMSRHVTAMSQFSHNNVTALLPQSIENNEPGSETQQNCDTPYINKPMRIGKRSPERARGSAPCGQVRVHVRRVLWRREKVVVYQDTRGRYWWADLESKKKRSALIGRHDAT
jgi:hypothetical protein